MKKIKLGDLWTESKIVSENPDSNKRIKVKLNVEGVEKRPNKNDKAGATKYFKRKAGQFIYGKQNLHKGAFGVIPKELDGFESSSDIPSFDINKKCLPEWIYYYFKQRNFYKELEQYSKGTGSKRIHPNKIAHLEIPLPSLSEQKQIVKKIQSMENEIKGLEQNVSYDKNLLIKLKQSILSEAVQGKWKNLSIKKIFKVLSSRNKQIKAKNYLEEGKFPIVDQGKNLIPGYSNDGTKLIKLERPVIIFGDHTRQIKYIDFDFIAGADGTKILEPVKEILPKFFYYVLEGYNLANKGYSRHFKILKQQEFPLPPLSEQHRIVEKVDRLMALCDELELRIKENKKNSESLMGAVLRESFEDGI